MVIRIATFIFTCLLFAVSSASIVLDPLALVGSDVDIPANKSESEIDPVPSQISSRSHPIKRHSFDRTTRDPLRFVRHHPCSKFKKMFMIPTKLFYGNDMILSDETTSVDLKTIGDRIPTKWLNFKHKYRHHHDKDKKLDGERLNSMTDHHKEKKKEPKAPFMRRVRKFLKHTLD